MRKLKGIIDGRKARKVSRNLRELAKVLAETPEKLQKKYEKKAQDELYDTFYSVISEFYADYEPWIYRRHSRGLELLLVLEIKNGKITGYFDPDRMPTHRAPNDYLYDTVFIEGWHGGASKGAWSPNTTLYYREPTPKQAALQGIAPYSRWGREANRAGFSPKEKSIIQMQEKMKELNDEFNEDFQNILKKVMQQFDSF